MRVAAEPIYETLDEERGLSRLAIPAGSEVSDDDLKRLSLKKNDPRLGQAKQTDED
jgi:hypothetical protein